MEALRLLTGEIRELEFFTAYDRPVPGEKPAADIAPMSSESLTDQAYVPPEVLISDFVAAGQRLDAARRARFDTDVFSEGDVEDIPPDPTRDPNLGIDDIVRLGKAAERRLEDARKEKAAEKSAVSEPAPAAAEVKS